MNLTVKEKYVEIGDVISVQKGSATRIIRRRAVPLGVSLFLPLGRCFVPLEGTTINGSAIGSNDELYEFLKTNLFIKGGGGTGEGVLVNFGNTLVEMDGEQTVFTVPHLLGVVPDYISITFGNAGNLNFVQSQRSVDITNIYLTCDSPPVMGSQTVYWEAKAHITP